MARNKLYKIVQLILGGLICSHVYAFKPSEYPRFLQGIKDSYSIEELIGNVFIFQQETNAYGGMIDTYSDKCFYLNPDTIVLRHKKKGMEEGTDFFVLSQLGSKITYKEKKTYSNEKDFNPLTYNERTFKKLEFHVRINKEDAKKYLYNNKWRLVGIDTLPEYSMIFENLSTNEKILYKPYKLYTPGSYYFTPTILIPCNMLEKTNECFPKYLYKTYSTTTEEYTKAKTSVYLNLKHDTATVDIDVLYGLLGGKSNVTSLLNMQNLLTKPELDEYTKTYTIDYKVNSAYVVDSSLVETIAGRGKTGVLLQYKGGFVSQEVSKGTLQNKSYLEESIVWFAGIDTIQNNVFYKLCQLDKVFYAQKQDISFYYQIGINGKLENSTDAIDIYKSLPRAKQEAFFEYNKRFVCYELFSQRKNDYLEYLEKYKKMGIIVEDMGLYSNHGYSTGFSFRITNLVDKTIKYIEIGVTGLNAVRDKVVEKGKTMQTIKCVGPINPYETASYNFEHTWWTDLVRYYNVNYYLLTYMDGTTKKIKENEDPCKNLYMEALENRLNFLPKLRKQVY